MNNTVAVIGGSGLLGSEMVRVLETEGWMVVAPSHGELDILDSEKVTHFFANCSPAYVINTAAYIDVDACESDPVPAWHINALGAGNVARALWQNKRTETKLIHMSTNYVFEYFF